MTNKQLKGIIDGLLVETAAINDFDLDQDNPVSVHIANSLLCRALEELRETIVASTQATTQVRLPPQPGPRGIPRGGRRQYQGRDTAVS